MFSPDAVVHAYRRNLELIQQQMDGLTHAESLLQPPADWNCAHWIVGHIACYRNAILAELDEAPTLAPETAKRHGFGSPPVRGEEPGLARLADLLRAIAAAQPGIERGIGALTPARAAEVVGSERFRMPRQERLVFLMRHEAFHGGQLEFLRALALSDRPRADRGPEPGGR